MHIGQLAADVVVTTREVTSNHASTRLRALIPSRALIARGHRVSIFPDHRVENDAAEGRLVEPDLMVVHKARIDLSGHLQMLKTAGRKVVLDICDHVIALPHLSGLYLHTDLLSMADAITTPTDALAEVLSLHVRCPIIVIPDAIEGRRVAPAANPLERDGTLRLLWFGRSQNLAPLIAQVSAITPRALGGAAVLEVMTNQGPAVDLLRSRIPEGLTVEISPWTLDGLEAALDRADLVLLPTDAEPSRQMKSANRLERALWAGRLPIAMSCPVADAYADSAIVADDLGMGIRRALADPAAWQARIAEGQARVAETRTGQVLAPLWEAAFLKAL